MIFRDKKTGTLLNIRRDDYVNDRLYYAEIIRVVSAGCVGSDIESRPLRYTQRFSELQSENNDT